MMDYLRWRSRLIIHCSDTEDDGGHLDADNIRRYHTMPKNQGGRGWSDVGYHWLIERYKGEMLLVPGRHPNYKGAHCVAAGRNHDSLGICIVGDFDESPPEPEVWEAAVTWAALIATAHRIPAIRIHGHSEFERRKTCPGLAFNMDAFRRDVRAKLSGCSDDYFEAGIVSTGILTPRVE